MIPFGAKNPRLAKLSYNSLATQQSQWCFTTQKHNNNNNSTTQKHNNNNNTTQKHNNNNNTTQKHNNNNNTTQKPCPAGNLFPLAPVPVHRRQTRLPAGAQPKGQPGHRAVRQGDGQGKWPNGLLNLILSTVIIK